MKEEGGGVGKGTKEQVYSIGQDSGRQKVTTSLTTAGTVTTGTMKSMTNDNAHDNSEEENSDDSKQR